jgi:hypothetical protein
MASVDAHAQVLEQPDLLPTAAVSVVAGQGDDVQIVDDRQRTGEVGDEDERGLQRGDEDGLEPVVVDGDLGAQLLDPAVDLLGGQVDVADPLVDGGG